jgi:hypothetical protein
VSKPLNQADLTPRQIAAVRKLFVKGNLSLLMHSTQHKMTQAFDTTLGLEYLALSARQLGKSWWLLGKVIETAAKFPGSRLLYYAPTKDKLRDIIADNIEPMQQWAPEGFIRRHKSSDRWFVGGFKCPKTGKIKGSSEIRLCVLERAHVDRNRGINAKVPEGELGIAIEEGCFVSSEDFQYAWESVIDAQRLRHNPRVAIATTPSVDEDHYIHTVLLPRLEMEGAVARYTIYDNPFLTPERIEKIKLNITEEVWKREYLAEIFRSKESVAVPEYNDDTHVFTLTPPPFANWVTTIDFGGKRDPHGIQLCYFDFNLRKFCVFKEALVPVNSSIAEIVDIALSLEKHLTKGPHFRVIDCQGQVSLELSKINFGHMTPTKGPGSFDATLQSLRVAFQNDQVVVDKSCTKTRSMLKYGKLSKQKDDFHRNAEHHCDLIASLMYAHLHKQTHNPFPDHYGYNSQTHQLQPKQPHPLLAMGHSFK